LVSVVFITVFTVVSFLLLSALIVVSFFRVSLTIFGESAFAELSEPEVLLLPPHAVTAIESDNASVAILNEFFMSVCLLVVFNTILLVSFFEVSIFNVSFLVVSILVLVVESILTDTESPDVLFLWLLQAANDNMVTVIRLVLMMFFMLLMVKCLQCFNAAFLKR
jgi:hypothetical protein